MHNKLKIYVFIALSNSCEPTP